MIKKGVSLTEIGLVIVIGIFMVVSMFLFISETTTNASVVINESYNESFTNLQLKSAEIDNTTVEIKSKLNDITEADSTIQVAWNGMKGILAILKLPLAFVDTALESYNILVDMLYFIPPIAINTVTFVITIVLVFALFKIFTNRSTDP